MSTLYLWGPALVAVLAFGLVRKYRSKNFVDALPGPLSTSWLVGNIPDFQRVQNVNEEEPKWVEKYGTAFKFKGAFGEDIIYLADPKAIHYILNTCGYNFERPKEQIEIVNLITGKGILAVEGSEHARHRKIMNPAFAYTSLKGLLPVFSRLAQKTAKKWRERAVETGESSPVIDVSKWLPRLTLDIIGEAALNFSFGALDNVDNELTKVYDGLLTDAFHDPSNSDIIFRAALAYLPGWAFSLVRFIPISGMKRIRTFIHVAFSVARRLVDKEVSAMANGKPPGKDAMSLFVRANSGENPKGKLSDHELLAEMTTLMIAGHETTASTLGWLLYELSHRPDYQRKIREEIRVTRARAFERGDEALNVTDLESMTCTVAAMKETLRLHPIGLHINRNAGRADTIPLSTPQRSKTGEMLTAIPISKGQKVMLSVLAYNLLKELWGEDSRLWRPERFIEGNKAGQGIESGLGVYANLATFGSGLHGCIGWRFAILEIQSVMIELLDTLEFAPVPGIEIIGVPAATVATMVKGQTDRGTQLPLKVTPLKFTIDSLSS